MAFIEIIQLPGGKTSCAGYFYKEDKKILPGETAWVSDAEPHLKTRLVTTVTESAALERLVNDEEYRKGFVDEMADELTKPPVRRGRKPKVTDPVADSVDLDNAVIREEASD